MEHGLSKDYIDFFTLGETAFNKKQFKISEQYFKRCTEEGPTIHPGWRNLVMAILNQQTELSGTDELNLIVQKLSTLLDLEMKKTLIAEAKNIINIKNSQPFDPSVSTGDVPCGAIHIQYHNLLKTNKTHEAINLINNYIDNSENKKVDATQFINHLIQQQILEANKLGFARPPNFDKLLQLEGMAKCIQILNDSIQESISNGNLTAEDRNIFSIMANLLVILHKIDEARKIYLFLLKEKPNDKSIKKCISICYHEQCDYEKAIEYDETNCFTCTLIDAASEKTFFLEYKAAVDFATAHKKTAIFTPSPNSIVYQDEEINLSQVHDAWIAGLSPLIGDKDRIWVGNRRTIHVATVAGINCQESMRTTKGMVIHCTNPENYYHFLTELTAKWYALTQTTNEKVKNIIKDTPLYICSHNPHTRHRISEIKEMLDIKQDVVFIKSSEKIYFETLYILDIASLQKQSTVWDRHVPHRKTCLRLRNKFLSMSSTRSATNDEEATTLAETNDTIVKDIVKDIVEEVVTAKLAPRGAERQFDNETAAVAHGWGSVEVPAAQEADTLVYLRRNPTGPRGIRDDSGLTEMLQGWCDENKLEFVILNKPVSIEDHRKIFSKARIIFGCHGGGFVNMLFVPKNCLVFEIPIYKKNNMMFDTLARYCNLKYVNPPNLECHYLKCMEKIEKDNLNELRECLNNNF